MVDASRPCPDAALLAAFLDNALAEYERTAVVTHLAECAQCRSVALAVIEFREVETLDDVWRTRDAVPADEERVMSRVSRWTQEKTRAPAWFALAAVLAIALSTSFYYYILSSRRAPQPITILTDAVQGQRVTEARPAGGFEFAPAPGVPSAAPRDTRVVFAANNVRGSYGSNYAPEARRSVGLAALLVGDLDEAVASLRIAALAAANDAEAANDLAVALYERARQANRAEDLPAALDAVERAVHLDPTLKEAWFNRALILADLGFTTEARDAWRTYEERDPASPWTTEARRRRQTLPVEAAGRRQDILTQFEKTASADLARAAVADYPSHARELFERSLKSWSTAVGTQRDVSHIKAVLRTLAAAFVTVQGEHFYRDITRSIEAAVSAAEQRRLAAAHDTFFQALASSSSTATAARASRDLTRARRQLSEVNSPLWLRAELELSTSKWRLRQLDEAAAPRRSIQEEATVRGYRVIRTRALWIRGLIEFDGHDVAAAAVAYEEMLESAALPADLDQFVMANVLLANAQYVLGNESAAWRYRAAAMSRFDQCANESTRSNVLLSAAGQATAEGHSAAALLFESRSLPAAGSLNPVFETQARIQRASTLHRLGRPEAARAELLLARAGVAKVDDAAVAARREADLLAVESELVQTADSAAALRLAERALVLAARTGDPYQLSRLHGRVAEAAVASGHLEAADSAISKAIASMTVLRNSRVTRDAGASAHELSLFATAARIAARRGDLARAFAHAERGRVQRLHGSGVDGPAVASLAEVQRRLERETALLVLDQFAEQLLVWVITRDDVAVEPVDISSERAASLALSQLQELAQPTATPGVSAQLFDIVVRPIWRRLAGARTVAVIANGAFSHIAFAGLWDRGRSRYLIEDFRLIASPSATTFVAGLEHADASRTTRRVAVVAPAPPGSSALLHGTVSRELQRAYNAAQVDAISVTPARLLAAIAERDVLHISAPVVGSGQPSHTRLLVADEPGRKYSGSISAAELATAPAVRAHLVSLQTDSANATRPESSDGEQQVIRALLAAGVPTVIGRVGDVPRAGLDATWVEFHRQYASGISAADSLQRAQIAALNASSRRAGAWATLTVFGSNQ
jgi:tetratricopeptide (TPR) repeat protein